MNTTTVTPALRKAVVVAAGRITKTTRTIKTTLRAS